MSNLENPSQPKIKWGLLFAGLFLLIILGWLGFRIVFPDSTTFFAASAPENLGVEAGKLADCPTTVNCISSQAEDAEHGIDPIAYKSENHPDPIADLETIVKSFDRTKIVAETSNYLRAEITSRWFGFVDDVEFYLNEDSGIIEVRSAARLGESDLGVNRERMESIRSEFSSSDA
ncbi:MAG: DUF1499 domain-containing protein [Prochloraceae cyanobacterium]